MAALQPPLPGPFDSVAGAVRAGLPEHVMRTLASEMDAIFNVLTEKRVLFVSQLHGCSRNDLLTWFGEASPPIERHLLGILESALQHTFHRSTGPPSSAASSLQSGIDGSQSATEPKPKTQTLGNVLESQGRWHEVEELFGQRALFEKVLVENPQVTDGKPLNPKADQLVTNQVLVWTWAHWGFVNVDMQFCVEVQRVLKTKHKLFMPTRGQLSAEKRSWANSLHTKFPQFRSKSSAVQSIHQTPLGCLRQSLSATLRPPLASTPTPTLTNNPNSNPNHTQGLYKGLKVSKDDLCEAAVEMWQADSMPDGIVVLEDAPSILTPSAVQAAEDRINEAIAEYQHVAAEGGQLASSKLAGAKKQKGPAKLQSFADGWAKPDGPYIANLQQVRHRNQEP